MLLEETSDQKLDSAFLIYFRGKTQSTLHLHWKLLAGLFVQLNLCLYTNIDTKRTSLHIIFDYCSSPRLWNCNGMVLLIEYIQHQITFKGLPCTALPTWHVISTIVLTPQTFYWPFCDPILIHQNNFLLDAIKRGFSVITRTHSMHKKTTSHKAIFNSVLLIAMVTILGWTVAWAASGTGG